MCMITAVKKRCTGAVQALVVDVEATKDPVIFVQKLLDLRDKYMNVINKGFKKDRQFTQELNLAFEVRVYPSVRPRWGSIAF